jgi:hypothetical protein
MMRTLMDTASGAYRVLTQSAEYLIDLDRKVLRRIPGDGGGEFEVALLRRDIELITLLQVVECTVGRPMSLLIDLHVLGVPYTARNTTPVVSIKPVEIDRQLLVEA